MTKAEIIDSVYERVGGFSKKEAAEVGEYAIIRYRPRRANPRLAGSG